MSKRDKHLLAQMQQLAKRQAMAARAARTFAITIQGHQHIDDEQKSALGLACWGALDALTKGSGTDHDVDTLASAINVSLILAERTPGGEMAVDAIKDAQDALMRVKARQERIGKHGLDAPGLQALRVALDIHEQQIALHKSGELESALVEAIKRMRNGDVLEVA